MSTLPSENRASSRRVELILDQVDRLPTLSPIAMRLLALGSADEVDIEEVVSLLSSDPALTSMILGLCRKADRGLASRITTVKRAVVMLGLDAVRSAVLSVTVYELIRDQEAESERLGRTTDGGNDPVDRAGLWKHAIAVACCAELLAEEHPSLGVNPEEAFVAGLLHDVGRLVLDLVLPKAVSRVSELAERRGSDSAAIERQIIGIDHHTAGRRVAQGWGLPTALQDVMWRHGQPLASLPDEPHKPLIGLVTLAKAYCRMQHIGWSGDFAEPADARRLARELGLPERACEKVLDRLIHAVVDRSAVLHLEEQSDVELLIHSVGSANARLARLNAQLREQADTTQAQEALIAAIAKFVERSSSPTRVSAAVERVTTSAAALLGPGYFGLVIRPWSGEPWRIYEMDEAGRHVRSDVVDVSPALCEMSIAGVMRGPGRPVDAPGGDAWMVEVLAELAPPADAMALPLIEPGGSDEPVAILIHNRRSEPVWRDAASASALAGVWGTSLRAAAAVERADSTSESLAEATRELADTQAILAERQSLARIGELTAGAAHELNTPLAIARGRAEMLASRLDRNSADRAEVDQIAEAMGEISSIISDLHDLASVNAGPPVYQSLLETVNAAAETASERVRSRGGSAGMVATDLGPVVTFYADPSLVERSLTEVLCNAFDAAPGEPVKLTAQIDAADSRVIVRIMDRGAGFSERATEHGFDPFFSEKPAGRGRGLGLARVRRWMDLIRGSVSLGRTREGGGCVTLLLPLDASRGEVSDPRTFDTRTGEAA